MSADLSPPILKRADAVQHAAVLIAVLWVVTQWWWASPLSFTVGHYIPLLDIDQQKFGHLTFALAFAALVILRAAREHYNVATGLVALIAVPIVCFPSLYLLIQGEQLALRAGNPTDHDIVFGCIGLLLLLLVSYIELSRGLVLLSLIAIVYLLLGDQFFVPDALQWKGASLKKIISHLWLYTEGVFGISIGVATQFIFLFVLFGEVLQRAGFGQFITQISLALFSGQKAGHAKAAIISSTAIGSISGSSTANVATTGSFTIPLMVKNGMSKNEAGAVEVAASSNGQLMPPIMGAAAFLMAEYTNTPYHELIYHALLPATCACFGLLAIIHLRACANTPDTGVSRWPRIPDYLRQLHNQRRIQHLILKSVVVVVGLIMLYLLRQSIPPAVFLVLASAGLVVLYLYWLRRKAAPGHRVETRRSATKDEPVSLDEIWRNGVHFTIPVIVLLWLLIVENFSPRLSIWWTVSCAFGLLWTHDALLAWFRSGRFDEFLNYYRRSSLINQFYHICLITVKRMLPISLATACAGIIVGTITLSGLQQILGYVVLLFTGDSFFLLLILLALASLLLGLGLPTTPNYILISSLFAGVLYSTAQQFGLAVPLLAVHLFVLYFGVLADDTPPVGLCAFTACAISGGDPIKTGIQAFIFDIRTAILPLAFIYNSDLLLIGLNGGEAVLTFAVSMLAMYFFAAGLQSWFIIRNTFFESALLLAASLILLCPQWLHTPVFPRWVPQSQSILQQSDHPHPDSLYRLVFTDPESSKKKIMSVTIKDNLTLHDEIEQNLGITLDNKGVVNEVALFSPADDLQIIPDWQLVGVESEDRDRPHPRWFWLLAGGLVVIVIYLQRARRTTLPIKK